MDLFYCKIIFYWCMLIFLIWFLVRVYRRVTFSGLQWVKFFCLIIVCLYFMPNLVDIGIAKPFLSQMNIKDLTYSTGICNVYKSSKFYRVTLDNDKKTVFDFSLMSPIKDMYALNNRTLRVWHYKGVVYQYSVDDEIEFTLDLANERIASYNFFIAPLGYLGVTLGLIFILVIFVEQ